MQWKHTASGAFSEKYKVQPSAGKITTCVFLSILYLLWLRMRATKCNLLCFLINCVLQSEESDLIGFSKVVWSFIRMMRPSKGSSNHTEECRDGLEGAADTFAVQPCLAWSDFHLFGPLKESPCGIKVEKTIQCSSMSWTEIFGSTDKDFYAAGFTRLKLSAGNVALSYTATIRWEITWL